MKYKQHLVEHMGQPGDGKHDEDVQARCGKCGQMLHPELDDIFVELCRACEHTTLKSRQSRANVPHSHPKRLPKQ